MSLPARLPSLTSLLSVAVIAGLFGAGVGYFMRPSQTTPAPVVLECGPQAPAPMTPQPAPLAAPVRHTHGTPESASDARRSMEETRALLCDLRCDVHAMRAYLAGSSGEALP